MAMRVLGKILNANLAIATVVLLLLGLSGIPLISNVSNAIIYLFLLGFFARKPLGLNEKERVLLESCLLSMGLATVFALLMGAFLPPAGLLSRIIMALFVLFVMLLSRGVGATKLREIFIGGAQKKQAILLLLAIIAWGSIFLLNPTIMFLSDGWWHCSIYNTVDLKPLPPDNPWMSGSSLAYPFSYQLYLNYAFGGGSAFGEAACIPAFNSFSVIMAFITMLVIFWLAKDIYKKPSDKLAFIVAFMFFFISTIGGIAFIFDLLTKLPSQGLENYLAFLKSVHGPHAWYSFAKFTGLPGIGMPFAQNAMVGSFHLPLLFGILYFSLRRRFFEAVLMLAPLVSSQPMLGILMSLTFAGYVLLTRYLAPAKFALLAIAAMIVDGTYIIAMFSKVGSIGSSIFGITANAFLGAANFLVAYSPLVLIALFSKRGEFTGDGKKLLIAFSGALMLVLLSLNLGYLYVTMPAYLVLVLLAAPYFENVKINVNLDFASQSAKINLFKISILAVLSVSVLIIFATYAYYRVPLSQPDIDASTWARENTKADSVFLPSLDIKSSLDEEALRSFWLNAPEAEIVASAGRQTNMYIAVFGERRSYIGDLQTLFLYGEDFTPRLETYRRVFIDRNETSICGLRGQGVDYIYASNESFYFENVNCLSQVYDNGKVRIYSIAG